MKGLFFIIVQTLIAVCFALPSSAQRPPEKLRDLSLKLFTEAGYIDYVYSNSGIKPFLLQLLVGAGGNYPVFHIDRNLTLSADVAAKVSLFTQFEGSRGFGGHGYISGNYGLGSSFGATARWGIGLGLGLDGYQCRFKAEPSESFLRPAARIALRYQSHGGIIFINYARWLTEYPAHRVSVGFGYIRYIFK